MPSVDESAGQSSHVSVPTAALYVSAAQASHSSAGAVIVPWWPASHRQSATAVVAVSAVVASAGQSMQLASCSAPRYCPVSQALQLLPGAVMRPL